MAVTPTPEPTGEITHGLRGRGPRNDRGRGFGRKRLGLPCLERSDDTENAYFFGERPIPSTGSGDFVL